MSVQKQRYAAERAAMSAERPKRCAAIGHQYNGLLALATWPDGQSHRRRVQRRKWVETVAGRVGELGDAHLLEQAPQAQQGAALLLAQGIPAAAKANGDFGETPLLNEAKLDDLPLLGVKLRDGGE